MITYDLMGNRTRAETITAGATQLTNYTYNSANQLISDGAQSFSYDANGRLISAGDRSYTYALNDRLIALSQPGLSATFAYNGDGVRLAQTTNGSTVLEAVWHPRLRVGLLRCVAGDCPGFMTS